MGTLNSRSFQCRAQQVLLTKIILVLHNLIPVQERPGAGGSLYLHLVLVARQAVDAGCL